MTTAYARISAADNRCELMGSQVTILASGDETAGAFSMIEMVVPRGSEPPPHTHEREVEGFYVLRGEVEHRVGGETTMAATGDFVLLPRGVEHWTRALTAETRLLLFTSPGGLDRSFAALAQAAGANGAAGARALLSAFADSGVRFSLARPGAVHGGEPREREWVPNPGLVRRPRAGESLWYMGHLFTVLAGNDETDGRFTLIEAVAERGGEPPRHVHHREEEAYYVLEGEATFCAGDQVLEAGPGTFVFLPKGVPHHFEIRSETMRALILLTPGPLEGFFRAFAEPAPALTLPPPPEHPYDFEAILRVGAEYGIEWLPPA